MGAPFLREFCCRLEHHGQVFSSRVLEAAPALTRIELICINNTLGGAALDSISAAFRRGALRNLQELELGRCYLEGGSFLNFVDALERSDCTRRLVALRFEACDFDEEGMRALGELLSQDGFPALKDLYFAVNSFGDAGVVALANGLLKAAQTALTTLDLSAVGMGDDGIMALASLVDEGRFRQLKRLHLSHHDRITNESIIVLAKAIGRRGLPMLKTFEITGLNTREVTGKGAAAIAHVIIKGSPHLTRLHPRSTDRESSIYSHVVYGMLLAVGRESDDGRDGSGGVVCWAVSSYNSEVCTRNGSLNKVLAINLTWGSKMIDWRKCHSFS